MDILQNISRLTKSIKVLSVLHLSNPSLGNHKIIIQVYLLVKWCRMCCKHLMLFCERVETKLKMIILKAQTKIASTLAHTKVLKNRPLANDVSDMQQIAAYQNNSIDHLKREMISKFDKAFDDVNQLKEIIPSVSQVKQHLKVPCQIGDDTCKVPTVTSLSEIPLPFYYYRGDKNVAPGLYCRVSDNVIVRIPRTKVVADNVDSARFNSIACTYDVDNKCTNNNCTFAHKKDVFTKIGLIARCPGCPSFGNSTTLRTDLHKVSPNDINRLLFYGLNDLISAFYYYDKKPQLPHIISNIDICTDDTKQPLNMVDYWEVIPISKTS